MPKSDKFTAKVPKLEDITLNWVDSEGNVDEEKAKKALHTLMLDKAKAQDAREDALADKKAVESQRDEATKALEDKADPDLKAELEKERKLRIDAEGQRDEAVLAKDRLEIAIEKSLTPAQAKRLVGKDREELEADAEELVKDLGITPDKQDDEGENEEGRVAPKSRLRSGGDPNPDESGSGNVDFEAEAAKIVGTRPW